MTVKFEDGWIIMSCHAPHSSRVQIRVGSESPVDAFRGIGTAMIRPPANLAGKPRIELLVDGIPTYSGTFTEGAPL